MRPRHVAFGLAFGFMLVRSGVTEFDAIHDMFLFRDAHLVGVIGIAIAVSAIGFALLKRGRVRSLVGDPLALTPKPGRKGLVLGGLLFGVGWALSGTCPGAALAQIGHGQLAGLVTFAGILLGVWAHARVSARPTRRVVDQRPTAETLPAAATHSPSS